MIEFYTWPRAACYLITLLLDLCILSQSIVIVLSYYRRPRLGSGSVRDKRFVEILPEFFVLLSIVTCSLLHGRALEGYYRGLYVSSGYVALRIAVFSALVLTAAAASALKSKPAPLVLILFPFITLPVIERYSGRAFAYLFTAGLLFALVRGIWVSILRYREIKTSLSVFSVKNAIDTMDTGILFSEKNGFILLSNARMEELIKIIFGTNARRDANELYERLELGSIACKKVSFEGQIVCLLSDESSDDCTTENSAWMFTRTELKIGRKKYYQLSAARVTEQWRLTEQLRAKNGELEQKNEELIKTIANLHVLSRERVTQKAKMRAHDVLGQSLTLLLRGMDSGRDLDYAQFRSLLQRGLDLLDQLKSENAPRSAQDEYESLKQAFGSIGVEIRLNGKLPPDGINAGLVLDIIRESVTNAVRHAYASIISVTINWDNGAYYMEISDNGKAPTGATPMGATPTGGIADGITGGITGGIAEGTGLTGMRKKIEELGGKLNVVCGPRFTLIIDLPGGCNNV